MQNQYHHFAYQQFVYNLPEDIFFANGVNDKVYEMICKSYEAFGNTEEESLAKDYHHDTPDLNCDLIKHPEDSYCDSIFRDTSL